MFLPVHAQTVTGIQRIVMARGTAPVDNSLRDLTGLERVVACGASPRHPLGLEVGGAGSAQRPCGAARRRPDQALAIAQTLWSANPVGSATLSTRIVPSERSVATADGRCGQAIHSLPAGSGRLRSAAPLPPGAFGEERDNDVEAAAGARTCPAPRISPIRAPGLIPSSRARGCILSRGRRWRGARSDGRRHQGAGRGSSARTAGRHRRTRPTRLGSGCGWPASRHAGPTPRS